MFYTLKHWLHYSRPRDYSLLYRPQMRAVQMCMGEGTNEAEEQMCSTGDLRSFWSDQALPRQVAAHVKPLSADSDDTGQELLARVTQTCARADVHTCACVCICFSRACASAKAITMERKKENAYAHVYVMCGDIASYPQALAEVQYQAWL